MSGSLIFNWLIILSPIHGVSLQPMYVPLCNQCQEGIRSVVGAMVKPCTAFTYAYAIHSAYTELIGTLPGESPIIGKQCGPLGNTHNCPR